MRRLLVTLAMLLVTGCAAPDESVETPAPTPASPGGRIDVEDATREVDAVVPAGDAWEQAFVFDDSAWPEGGLRARAVLVVQNLATGTSNVELRLLGSGGQTSAQSVLLEPRQTAPVELELFGTLGGQSQPVELALHARSDGPTRLSGTLYVGSEER